jgi:hypothetical protein
MTPAAFGGEPGLERYFKNEDSIRKTTNKNPARLSAELPCDHAVLSHNIQIQLKF